MKGGFSLLTTRSISEKLNFDEIENVVLLPPLYKVFIDSFYVGEEFIEGEYYFHHNRKKYCSGYLYKNSNIDREILFGYFIEPKIGIYVYEEEEANREEMDVFCIGTADSNAGIYVGIAENNKDKIYYKNDSYKFIIANNIFEFVRGIEFVSNTEDPSIMQDVPYDKLYRNWGEDFWRVREDEKPA